MNGITFFFKHLPPFSGNIVFGVVAGYKHKRNECHTLCFGRFQLCQHGFKGGIAFDGPHMEVTESGYFQHIVHLTVCSSTGRISAMPYQYEVFFTLFLCTLLHRSIEALS